MAQKFSTPGVFRQETDISEVVAPAGTSIGAMVGWASQGPSNQRVLVTFDKEFIDVFGRPNSTSGLHGFGALEFLKESNSLWFVRATNGNEVYANLVLSAADTTSANSFATSAYPLAALSSVALNAAQPDGNKPDKNYVIDNTALNSGDKLLIAAVGPGAYGNNVGIRISTSALATSAAGVTATSANYDWVNNYDSPQDIFKLEVFTKDTTATSFTNDPIETFYVTRRQDLKDGNGKSMYVEDVINGISKFIYVNNSTVDVTPPASSYGRATSIIALSNGADGTPLSQTNIKAGWDLFADKTKVDVSILIVVEDGSASVGGPTVTYVGNIAASRKDCMAVGQADSSTSTSPQGIINGAPTGFTNASYVALYAGWDQIIDSFNDKKVFLPKAAFAAAIFARTDSVANVWDAPAGVNRGVLGSVDQNIIWNDAQIGQLYDANINTSKKIRGIGNVIWGQKTAQKKKSALDRINVRRMLLFVENSVENALLPFLFEVNSDITRLRVQSIINNFLEGVQAGGGLSKFEVVCDTSNNTPQVIDNNQLNVDIYVQPSKTIEFIKLQTVITRTGVNFSEVRV